MLIFGALHLVALALGVLLFVMFLRSESTDGRRGPEEDEGGGGGGNDRISARRPSARRTGRIPLPDADPARRPAARARAASRTCARGRSAGGSRSPRRTPRRVPGAPADGS